MKNDSAARFLYAIKCSLGSVTIACLKSGGETRISKIQIDRFAKEKNASIPKDAPLAREIERFMNGEDVEFSLEALNLAPLTPFQLKALKAVFKIKRGSVMTYREVAEKIGLKNGARAVAGAVASNPFPIIIPCHRVIRSDGKIGGYLGGEEMKVHLLRMEGIEIDEMGMVKR